jgi:Na+/H+ antiporter NhaD/arsenite permease-like protein
MSCGTIASVNSSAEIGGQLSLWALAPFALMLVAVAVMPLVARRWFHRNRNKGIVSFALGLPTLIYLIVSFGGTGLELAAKTAEEYISFIVLLLALFTISGGIHLTGNAVATPRHNLAYLATGAVLANLIGTMGASMVLIRPVLRANTERTHKRHTVIFFIFAVSNVGGLLTPLGDPPLFLGFLRGVAYAALEHHYHRKEPKEALQRDLADRVPMRLKGGVNLILLGLVIVTVLFSKTLSDAGDMIHFPFIREVILIVLAFGSLRLCPRGPRAWNNFCWPPMIEVAVLFAGIFATMIPALALLEARGAALGLTRPWQYFWATGGLSAFLDNAPTYLTLASVAQSEVGAATVGALTSTQVVTGLGYSAADFLRAISCGAVMMGAMTYIGNAPNFAVKAIAEHSGVKMPSFFHFMAYSVAILGPIFALATVVFFL